MVTNAQHHRKERNMKQTKHSIFKLATFLMALTVASVASASPIIMELDTVFDGDQSPQGNPPWIDVIFDDQTTVGSVAMTINTVGLIGSEFVSKMYFNMDPSIDADELTFTKIDHSGTFEDPSIKFGQNKKKAGPAKGFDLELSFATKDADRFGAGDSLTYLISGPMLIDSSIFEYTNFNQKPEDTYYAAAHIQGIDDDFSGRVGAVEYHSNVPEPATALMLTIGGLSVLTCRKRKPITADND
jgi:hypothetical protein